MQKKEKIIKFIKLIKSL